MSLSFFRARTLITVEAGFALNITSSLVNGLMPLRAFTAGLTPLTLGLLLSTGWVLTAPTRHEWLAGVLVLGTVVVSVRSPLSPMWLIGTGAVVGALALR